MQYKAFLSYSHAADGKLAPAVQSALHRFTKPWYRMRAFKIFRDKTSLAATPELWPSIERALEDSEYFILLASPQASESPWIRREVDWWLQHRSVGKLLIALTDGELVWDRSITDFDWSKKPPLPSNLQGRFKEEPLYVDLTWARTEENMSLRHSGFRAAILDLAATLHGKPKDELDGEDVRQYRKIRRLTSFVIVGLVLLALSLGWATYFALQQQHAAVSRELAARAIAFFSNDPAVSVLLATKAVYVAPTKEAVEVLRESLLKSHVRAVLRPRAGGVPDALLSPNGQWVVIATGEVAAIWNARTGRLLYELRGHRDWIHRIVFSPDSVRVVTASFDGTAQVWETATGRRIALLIGHKGKVQDLKIDPHGKWIATAGADTTIRIWEATSGRSVGILRGHSLSVFSVDFSPSGDWLASVSHDDSVRIWEISTGRSARLRGNTIHPNWVTFSPDGKLLLTLGEEGSVRIWDVSGRRAIGKLEPRTRPVSAAFSPDGNLVMTASGDDVQIWDIATKTLRAELRGHTQGVGRAIYNRDGTRVMTTSDDGTARIWDAETGQTIATLYGHAGPLIGISVSSDEALVATSGLDGTVRLWSLSTLGTVIKLPRHGELFGAQVSPDGRRIVIRGSDKTVRL